MISLIALTAMAFALAYVTNQLIAQIEETEQ